MSAPPVYMLSWHGCNHEGYQGGDHDTPVGTKWTDVWGVGWHKVQEGVMGFPIHHPLAKPAQTFNDYKWPKPDDERLYSKIFQMTEQYQDHDLLLGGSHRDPLWEKAHMLVGMEEMMMLFYNDPDLAREILHRIMDFQVGIAEYYLKVGVEIIFMVEDLGTQRGPLFNPRIVNEFLLPEYERLLRLYRERNVLIWWHSCGNVASVLDVLMDLGVVILNPVQATANDLEQLRASTNGRMALDGGISSPIIMEGPIDRIREEVRERIWQLGQNGGYFCGPDQYLDFPEAHIQALHEAVEEYGNYPLQPPLTSD
jgi:uroporphyrinogen decarboxylase